MSICILLVPEGASREAKLALMGRMSSRIHEAYPVTTTHIFMIQTHEARVSVFLICPPGVKADAKKTMMEKLTADISDVYPGSDDVFIIHREDDLANVMLNSRLQSENPKFTQTTPG